MTPSSHTPPPFIRHRLPDRLFHWVMAISVIVLGATAFLPLLDVKFDWVPIHWISGVVLGVAVIFHFWRVFFVHGLANMLPAKSDVALFRRQVLFQNVADVASGKFDVFHKVYHWTVSLMVLALLITGFIMMAKIDTPLWARNPAILSDWNWGIVYVVHGAASLFLLFLFIVHVYFSILPDHKSFLLAMILGPGPENAHQPGKESNP